MKLASDTKPVLLGCSSGCTHRSQLGCDVRQARESRPQSLQLRNGPPRTVSCSAAATLERLPLSNYDFPKLPSGAVDATPLESAVKEAVKHIEQAPFLQLHQGLSSTRHDISDAVLRDSQVWENITQTLEQRGAEIVLLVHRLDLTEPEKVRRKVGGTSDSNVMTGITSASPGRLESFAELLQTESVGAQYSGRVGDCCDEDMVSQVVPFTRPSHSKHSHHHATFARSQAWRDKPANYWGLVLQNRSNTEDCGCYVLKTVHSGVGDCTCVHWTLTRVRQGTSFFEQLNSAWLL